jgi:YVTN family beta-propeller protein
MAQIATGGCSIWNRNGNCKQDKWQSIWGLGPHWVLRHMRLPFPRSSRIPTIATCSRRLTRRASRTEWSAVSLMIGLALLALAACHQKEPPPRPYLAFAVNNQSQSVAVVDLAAPRVIRSIPVEPLPEKAMQRPGHKEIYVTSQSGKLSVIEFPALTVAHTIDVGQSAGDVTFSPDGDHAYVLEPKAGQIVFLDCNTRKETGRVSLVPNLAHMAITPDGKTLIASDPAGNQLILVDTETQTVLGNVKVGKGPGPLAVSLDSSAVFVADTGDEKISAAEISSRTILAHIETGSRPNGLVLKPDGGELFVLSDEASTLTIVDAAHNNVEQVLPTGRNPVATVFKRDSSVMYLATEADGFVTAFDLVNRAVEGTVHAGVSPQALALTPDERFLAVVDSATGSLAILSPAPLSLVTVLPVGSNPTDVIIPGWEWNDTSR